MASLSSNVKIGNTSASSLLRSSSSLSSQLADYQDKVAAADWANSAKTADDWATYQAHLSGRISRLSATGVLSDASKALTMSDTLRTAGRSYVSNEIARQSISILEGNSTPTDKYNTIVSAYRAALSNGDDQLAQSLRSQADNLSQQIQYQQVEAAKAADSLQKANQAYSDKVSNQEGASYASIADSLNNGLKQLSNEYKTGGQLAFNQAFKQFASDHAGALKAMGVKLPTGAAPSMGDVISGVVLGIHNYYDLASKATTLSNPGESQRYSSYANNITSGITKFDTPAGSMSAQDIVAYQKNPNMYVEKSDASGNYSLVKSNIAGYSYDANGNVVDNPTGSTDSVPIKNQKDIEKQLVKLGFGEVKRQSDGTFKVQLTDKTSSWLDPNKIGKTQNEELSLVYTPQGFQFRDNSKIYTLTTDSRGLGGVFQNSQMGLPIHIAGQYGFNQQENGLMMGLSGGLGKDIMLHTLFNKPNSGGTASANIINQWMKEGLSVSVAQSQAKLIQTQDPTKVVGTMNGVSYNWAGDPIGKVGMIARPGGGFNFTNAQGQAISAATYAMQTGQSFRTLLGTMAAKGDTGASQALGFVGNDYGYDPNKVRDQGSANLYNALTWGDGKNITAKPW